MKHTSVCVLPSPTEDQLVTLPGPQPGTAYRLWLEPGPDGYVRVEQLAHTPAMGWYAQKTLIVPGEVLHALLPHLRKADCLIPRAQEPTGQDAPLLFIGPDPKSPPRPAERRRA